MKAGSSKRPVDWLLYVSVRALLSLLQALPWHAGRAMARLLGDLAYLLDRRLRKEAALANLQRAFPSLAKSDARRILRGAYRHVAASILDTLNFVRFASHWDSSELLEVVGLEKLQQVPRHSGVIFVSGHFGNWEVLGAAWPLVGCPVWSVGRGFRNRYINRYVRRLRETTGQHIVEKRGALRRILRLVRQGESVGFLIDQDARREGIFVEFFGRPASTTPSPARISVRTGAPVAFVYAHRLERKNRFRMVVENVIIPQRTDDEEAEVRRITQELTQNLEAVVRRSPQEWLWLHGRWKTYPGKYGSAPGRQRTL